MDTTVPDSAVMRTSRDAIWARTGGRRISTGVRVHFSLFGLLLVIVNACASPKQEHAKASPSSKALASSIDPVDPDSRRATGRPSIEQLRADPEIQTALQLLGEWIRARLPSRDIPGLSIAVAYDGEVLWAKGFGYADRDRKTRATPQTIYRLASITKLFTTTAIMQLRDAGKLSLHDPVVKHLPWFRLRDDPMASHPIRIRHLLTHTSGLPREAGYPYWTSARFPTKQELIAALKRQRRTFAPGIKWKYSNLGMSLAGQIVSAVSGKTYPDYVSQHIFKPLGMSDSSLGLPIDPRRFAVPYGPKLPKQTERPKRPSPLGRAVGPAVDLCSTVLDLVRFGTFQVRGRHAKKTLHGLDPVTFAQMHRVHVLSESWKLAFGLGFLVRRVKDTTVIGHGGAHIGFRSQLDISVADRLVVAVAANADNVGRTVFTDKAIKLLVPHLQRLARSNEKVPDTGQLNKYVGRYRNGWGDLLILKTKGRLAATYVASEAPEDHLIELHPVAEHAFRIKDRFGGPDGELCVFDVDPKTGQVVGLDLGGTTRRKIE